MEHILAEMNSDHCLKFSKKNTLILRSFYFQSNFEHLKYTYYIRDAFKDQTKNYITFKLHIFLFDFVRVMILLYLLDDIPFSLLKSLINDLLAVNVCQFNPLAF